MGTVSCLGEVAADGEPCLREQIVNHQAENDGTDDDGQNI